MQSLQARHICSLSPISWNVRSVLAAGVRALSCPDSVFAAAVDLACCRLLTRMRHVADGELGWEQSEAYEWSESRAQPSGGGRDVPGLDLGCNATYQYVLC
jgi:hypothetical protein